MLLLVNSFPFYEFVYDSFLITKLMLLHCLKQSNFEITCSDCSVRTDIMAW